jgi:hypothetical protein
MGMGHVSLSLQRQGREADNSLSSFAEVKNGVAWRVLD